jgi:hypothetical protein
VLTQQPAADMAAHLRSHGVWDLVDDRIPHTGAPISSTVAVEAVYE